MARSYSFETKHVNNARLCIRDPSCSLFTSLSDLLAFSAAPCKFGPESSIREFWLVVSESH